MDIAINLVIWLENHKPSYMVVHFVNIFLKMSTSYSNYEQFFGNRIRNYNSPNIFKHFLIEFTKNMKNTNIKEKYKMELMKISVKICIV